MLWLRRTPAALALVGLAGVALVARVARDGLPALSTGWMRDRTDESTAVDEHSLFAYVRQEHPDWDDSRVARVVRGLGSDGTKHENEKK